MAYQKTTWVNDQTPVNAENMNHIEDGIATLDDAIEELASEIATVVDVGQQQILVDGVVFPHLTVEQCEKIYALNISGKSFVVHWSLSDSYTDLRVISTDEIAGSRSIDFAIYNSYHVVYSWVKNTEEAYATIEVKKGSSIDLSNIEQDIIPKETDKYNIGSTTFSFREGHFGKIYVDGNGVTPTIIKTTMDSVAVANAQYYLRNAESVVVSLPAILNEDGTQAVPIGTMIYVNWYNGEEAIIPNIYTTDGTGLLKTYEAHANTNSEIIITYDGVNWVVTGTETEVPTEIS